MQPPPLTNAKPHPPIHPRSADDHARGASSFATFADVINSKADSKTKCAFSREGGRDIAFEPAASQCNCEGHRRIFETGGWAGFEGEWQEEEDE